MSASSVGPGVLGVSDICPQPLVTQRPDSGPAPLPLSDVVEVEVEVTVTTPCSSTQQDVRTQMCVEQHLLVVKATTS